MPNSTNWGNSTPISTNYASLDYYVSNLGVLMNDTVRLMNDAVATMNDQKVSPTATASTNWVVV